MLCLTSFRGALFRISNCASYRAIRCTCLSSNRASPFMPVLTPMFFTTTQSKFLPLLYKDINAARGYASRRSLPVYDFSGDVAKDTLVYSSKGGILYRFFPVFGIVMACFFLQYINHVRAVASITSAKSTSNTDNASTVLSFQANHRNGISIFLLLMGTVVLVATFMTPRRYVTSLHLLRGGERVQVETQGVLGPHVAEVPLLHITTNSTRATGSNLTIKIKNYVMHFFLDHSGTWHDPDLYDYVIGLKRDITGKKKGKSKWYHSLMKK